MRLIAAEFLKLRTTRTPWVLFGVAILISGLIAAGFAGFGGLDADNEDTLRLHSRRGRRSSAFSRPFSGSCSSRTSTGTER